MKLTLAELILLEVLLDRYVDDQIGWVDENDLDDEETLLLKLRKRIEKVKAS